MSINFIPLISWRPVEMPKWTMGSFGTDRASVLYRGPRTTMETFRATLDGLRWSKMTGYSEGTLVHWTEYAGMYLEDWSDGSGSPNFPGIELHYVGLKTGRVPVAHALDRVTEQSAQGSGTHAGKTVSGTIKYRAACTDWTWIETAEPPDVPREAYRHVNAASSPFENITGYSITDSATGKPVNTISLADLGTVLNALAAVETVTGYTADLIVPGKLWGCSATVENLLV